MTREELISHIKYSLKIGADITLTNEDAEIIIKALEQNDVLDKIRAEIEQEYTKFRNKSDMWSERACGLGTALEIIDKYRREQT